MEYNKTLKKIEKLMNERNWSIYKLAKESEIPYSSLNSLFLKNNQPTISTLEKICAGFCITMAEFFADTPPYRERSAQFSEEERSVLSILRSLNEREQKILVAYIKGFARIPL